MKKFFQVCKSLFFEMKILLFNSLFDFRRKTHIPTAHTITKRLCMEKICMILSLVQLSCVNKLLLEAAKYLLKVAEHFRPKVIFNEALFIQL